MLQTESQAHANIAVTVILPCRNEAGTIEACIRSILAQESPAGELELIVADGQSTDGTREILDQIASTDRRVRVIDNAGAIVSTGLNSAIAQARGQIIIRMDAHSVYAPDYIRQCQAVLEETKADNVGGPALTRAQGYVQQVIAAAYHSSFAVGGARFHDPQYEGYVDTVPYGCWPRDVFTRIGLFDEELVRNQDDEFNLRLTRSGGKIWQSRRIKSWYHTRASLRALFRQYQQYGYWKVRVIQKHRVPASFRHVIPGAFLMTLIVLTLLSLWWPIAQFGLAAVLAAYLAANLGASLLTARPRGWKLLPLLPLVYATYHFSYGFGFLGGLWDFVLTSQRPRRSMERLSRGPASV